MTFEYQVITGEVTPELEARIEVRLRGADKAELDLEVIIDTGFDGCLTLPLPIITELGWDFLDTIGVRLGNEVYGSADTYLGTIRWNGEWRLIIVQVQDSDETSLAGMALIKGSTLTVEAWSRGTVTIEHADYE